MYWDVVVLWWRQKGASVVRTAALSVLGVFVVVSSHVRVWGEAVVNHLTGSFDYVGAQDVWAPADTSLEPSINDTQLSSSQYVTGFL